MVKQSTSRRVGIGLMLLGIIGFYAAILSSRVNSNKRRIGSAVAVTHEKTLYKTINTHDADNSLLGFELHSSTAQIAGELHKQCSVIVRTMDPTADDYKTYCKDIVDELIGMYGEENLTVNIYDSFEAYSMVMDDSRLPTTKDEQFIAGHKVASFEAYYEDGDRLAFLTYYPEAANRYYERIGYSRQIL
ncbi:MAG: hypothetical protein KF744_06000 [Taibaiella sp.]|nr:hypothetical protein [Taibaiella sp.]